MTGSHRIVVDTNVLISGLLITSSVPSKALRKVVHTSRLLISTSLLIELANSLSRSKFDAYLTARERQEFLLFIDRVAERVDIVEKVYDCRDAKDNMILELAINGRADFILTGDKDLLDLSSFRGIAIMPPARYIGLGS